MTERISPARLAAVRTLLAVELDGKHSTELIADADAALKPVDRRLHRALVFGVLRSQIRLDRYIDALAGKKKLDPEVRMAIRLGLLQIEQFDRIPVHSAVSESVEIVKFFKLRSAAGFVNAVLRKFVREGPILKFADPIDELSVETSHPRWLLERWEREFGTERAAAIARVNNVEPEITFRLTVKGVNSGIDPLGFGAVNGEYDSFSVEEHDQRLIEMAADGLIYFQDVGSMRIAEFCRVGDGESFLDVCAAPGGKTGAIAASLSNSGSNAQVFAGDISRKRAISMRELMDSQGCDAGFIRYDAGHELPFPDGTFDRILVDAPCTGTGTIRNNPEIRYRLSESAIFEAVEKQRLILDNASKKVRAGGTLIYSTCSLEREENESVVAAFIASASGRFRLDREFRTFPDTAGGFYAARLECLLPAGV